MAKKLKFGNVILCDHVVPGERNKTTLVNVYSGDVVISEMPSVIMFGFYCEYFPETTDMVEVTIKIKYGQSDLAKITGQVRAEREGEVGQITIPLFPLSVKSDDYITVTASATGYRTAEILKKKIFIEPTD